MKKIGLCIVYKNRNYGSILQSYATLLKLEELGMSYEIIRYLPKKDVRFYIKSLPRILNKDMFYSKLRSLKYKVGIFLHPKFKINDFNRVKKFEGFVDHKFTHFSAPIKSYSDLKRASNIYSDVLVGSDQLWLPSGLASNFYNLMFVSDNTNKISYAASFGVSSIPWYQKKRTITYLNRIDHISVREHSGQKIVKELTNRNADMIVDPTLAISPQVWYENIQDQKIIDGEYIFCYFLGNNPYQRAEAKKLSQATGLKIVTLRHLDEYIKSDEEFGDYAPYDIGPVEFVNLIRHANYICTDSFHGSVFSIINHKQFITFNRYAEGKNSRNSRVDTLFLNVGINRRFTGDIVREMMSPIDYQVVDEKLKVHREFADKFIRYALGVDKDD